VARVDGGDDRPGRDVVHVLLVNAGAADLRMWDTTVAWLGEVAEQAPDARLTLIPEADHFPMLSAPKDFERIVRQALTPGGLA
jgi:pimeloyl-ACP methyl ester carboxylesterase